MPALFGWVNILPEHLVVDADTVILTLSRRVRNEHLVVYPRRHTAILLRPPGHSTHRVHADLPPGTVFEVIGRMGEAGDSFPYRVGLFADYADAFEVASSVNISGRRGCVRLVFDYEPVHRSLGEYAAARRKPRYSDQAYYLHSVVEITNDPVSTPKTELTGP